MDLSVNTEKIPDFYIDHEVRLRMLEKTYEKGLNLLRWILITAIGSVIVPIVLHHYHLV